jgi:hypothetical protein
VFHGQTYHFRRILVAAVLLSFGRALCARGRPAKQDVRLNPRGLDFIALPSRFTLDLIIDFIATAVMLTQNTVCWVEPPSTQATPTRTSGIIFLSDWAH